MGYEDFIRIFGLRRMDFECSFEVFEFVFVKGCLLEIECCIYVDRIRGYIDDGVNSYRFLEVNCVLNFD